MAVVRLISCRRTTELQLQSLEEEISQCHGFTPLTWSLLRIIEQSWIDLQKPVSLILYKYSALKMVLERQGIYTVTKSEGYECKEDPD